MRKNLRVALFACVAVGALLFTAGGASAGSNQLDGVLEGLEWGMSHDKVLDALKAKAMEEFDAEAATIKEMGKKDKLRKKYKDRSEALAKEYKQFKSSERSGLEVSIVSDEFVADNGESVLVLRDSIATKYYFFHNDKLYKIAVAYAPEYIGGLAFDAFVGAVAKKYGKQKKEGKDEDGVLNQAIWEDGGGNRLRVEDKWDAYDTFLMAFSYANLESAVAEKHATASKKRYADPTVSSEIESLAGDEWEASSGSAADALLGTSTAVDLKAGLPQEDLDAMADESVADGKGTGDKSGTSGKKVKRARRKRGPNKFGDVDKKKDAGDIIIY